MQKVDLREAAGRLPELVEKVARGEEVVITRSDGRSFRLVPLLKPRAKFGSAMGLVEISDDFDEPVDGFEDYVQ